MPGKATGTVRGVTQPHAGEARIEVADRWMLCYAQVRLRMEAGRGLDFICFEIFAWDRLASLMYAATAMSMWRNDINCKYMSLFPLDNLACKGGVT